MKRAALQRRTALQRVTELKRRLPPRQASGPVGHATPQQRAIVRDKACLVCARGPCDPAHLIPRAMAGAAADDPRAVVPLCRLHHRQYDDEQLDLSPHLEPHWRESIAWAVEAVGLFRALRRITGQRWEPVEWEAA